jgi:hypothetical protein
LRCFLCSSLLLILFVRSTAGQSPYGTIRMTTVPDIPYAAADSSTRRIALFSSDIQKYVTITERGILETNEREFSPFFHTSELLRSPKPEVLPFDAIANQPRCDPQREMARQRNPAALVPGLFFCEAGSR